jgi:two-component system cell cycle response regulator
MAARILIVEDNAANLELARYLLEHAGHVPQQALDGAQGLDALRSEQPDIVLCDLQMPVMNGFEMLREVRQDPALRGSIVIAISALSMASDRATALAAGFDGYLSKPIDPETFVADVEAFLPAALRAPRPNGSG